MIVSEVTEITDEIVAAFERIIPQLSSSKLCPSKDELAQIIASPATSLFIARDPDRQDEIIGTLTLALYRIPTGLRAWIEDVVVDGRAQKKGAGKALCRIAIQRAIKSGASKVDLTSQPFREAAHYLYQRLGFVQRNTNVYRYACTNDQQE